MAEPPEPRRPASSCRRLAVIVNPTAAHGRSLEVLRVARGELERSGVDYRVVESRSLEHAHTVAEAAVAEGDTVVAVGGDGLVGRVAGALRGSSSALAVVPAGRGNDFARAIGVPHDAAAAARLAVEGQERIVDMGEVNGAAFLCIASVGLDSDVNRLASRTRLLRGDLVYLYAALRALVTWRHAGFEVVANTQVHRVHGYSVAVANAGVYGGGMRLVPHAELDDGRLDVLMIGAAGRLRFLGTFAKVFRGTHVGHPALRFLTAETVEVSADRPFVVYADGEPVGPLPATICVRPGTLRVIAPPVARRVTAPAPAAPPPGGPPPRPAPSAAPPAGP
jgi:YegS/Rv2252/BmrU family lipid kinase